MYFPFLRGRQYDLLALKELARLKLISNNILPVIEPVKISSTFKSTILTYVEQQLPIAIVFNSSVSTNIDDDFDELINLYITNDNFIKVVLLVNKTITNILKKINKINIGLCNIILIFDNIDEYDLYVHVVEYFKLKPNYTFIPDDRSFKRLFNIDSDNLVILEDRFHKLIRNSDYFKYEDEFFSDIHWWYFSEHYKGFSDYSIVGKDYNETGFAPRAIAIHIVYVDRDKKFFRVRHFVSDSNKGIEDIAGKFFEAVTKLKQWHSNFNNYYFCDSAALSKLLEFADAGYYPGLPTLKKLSIMHHIELVNHVLNK